MIPEMPGQLGRLKSRKKKTSCKIKTPRTVSFAAHRRVFTFDWNFATFPRLLRPGFDPPRGPRCPRRAVKQALARGEAPASAANASSPPAGGGAPRLRRLKDARAKKTRTGTPAESTAAWTDSSWPAPSARTAGARSSPMTTAIRSFPWSISSGTWTSCRTFLRGNRRRPGTLRGRAGDGISMLARTATTTRTLNGRRRHVFAFQHLKKQKKPAGLKKENETKTVPDAAFDSAPQKGQRAFIGERCCAISGDPSLSALRELFLPGTSSTNRPL